MQMMFTVVTAALGSLTITFVVNAALQNMKTEQKNLKIRNNNKKKMPRHRLDFFFFFFFNFGRKRVLQSSLCYLRQTVYLEALYNQEQLFQRLSLL
jgi:hypothetical protein